MIAITGGLGAAIPWAAATLCSSRSTRMPRSRNVLAWIMIVAPIVSTGGAVAAVIAMALGYTPAS